MYFFSRIRHMFDSPWDDEKLSFLKVYILISEMDHQSAFDNIKHLFLIVMLVPKKFPLQFDDLHM